MLRKLAYRAVVGTKKSPSKPMGNGGMLNESRDTQPPKWAIAMAMDNYLTLIITFHLKTKNQ